MYSEDRSWFLTSWNYAKEVISEPAGLACYVGAFITQFLYFKTIGPAIIALLLFITERLIASISKAKCRAWIPLCWIPIVLIVKFILHTYSTLTPFAGIIICLISINALNIIHKWQTRIIISAILIPIALYTTGICGSIIGLYAICDTLCLKRNWKSKTILTIGLLLSTQISVLGTAYLSNHTILTIICGPYYTTYNQGMTEINNVCITIVIAIFIVRCNKWPAKPDLRRTAMGLLFACIPFAYFCMIDHKIAKEDESLIKMFIHGSRGDWEEVKKIAKEHRPEDGNSMNYYNLALARDGKMLDKIIENTGELGIKNILPEIQITRYIPKMFACNLFYELRLRSHVYQSAVEAQNCLLGKWQMSPSTAYLLGRTSAECGDKKNARKYSILLSKTMFHKSKSHDIEQISKKWKGKFSVNAKNNISGTDYSSRNVTPKELSISEIYNLFKAASNTIIGYQYLLAIDLFCGNFDTLKKDIDECPYKNIKHSKIIQEAYSFCLLKDGIEGIECPRWINKDIFEQAQAFISKHRLGVNSTEIINEFKGTYFAIIEKYSKGLNK